MYTKDIPEETFMTSSGCNRVYWYKKVRNLCSGIKSF